MKVTLYPANLPPKTVEVATFNDIQRLVGGCVEIAKSTSMGDLLFNEEGLPLELPINQHYRHLVGDVVLAPKGWDDLPYGD